MFTEHLKNFKSDFMGSFSIKSMMMTMVPPTVYYYQTAPEIRNESVHVSDKFDVFSFSLIAYQLLAKSELKTNEKEKYSIRSITHRNFRPDLDCIDNVQIKDLISHMWDQNPIYRPNFNDITDEIQKDYFIDYFSANRQKVEEYIALFEKKEEEQ